MAGSRYAYSGEPLNLDGKMVRSGDVVTLSDDTARQLMAHSHAFAPVDAGGVQPIATGASDLGVAGVVDEAGDVKASKK